MATTAKRKPDYILRSGAVSLAAFRFENKRKDGTSFDSWQFSLTRSYKKEDGSYDHSTFIQPNDMLIAAELMREAWLKCRFSKYTPPEEGKEDQE